MIMKVFGKAVELGQKEVFAFLIRCSEQNPKCLKAIEIPSYLPSLPLTSTYTHD